MRAVRIRVRGQVQGVGFRPFVWQLAHEMGILGDVRNDAEGVLIHAWGAQVDAFVHALQTRHPKLARVDAVEVVAHAFAVPPTDFDIAASGAPGAETRVTPDAATCPACLAEIRAEGRRQGYAFTNCTHCGPRFSILKQLPYDRGNTTMAPFAMCDACAAEYRDPADRRFHAQPIACPHCGPRVWLEVGGLALDADPIAESVARLRAGDVLAIKGLGGFHLAVDARNESALIRLRLRKQRPTKPFALMAREDQLSAICVVSDADRVILRDPAAPVVLMPSLGRLPEAVAPGMNTLGVMLPYTPLHHLLMDAFEGPLVMTSGNLSGEPQVIDNDEARRKLSAFADAFLMHDRDIARRLDDGVERADPPMVLRRARGRAPDTLPLPPGFENAPQILALGAQMKSAICLIKNGQALLSHHLGHLDDALTWDEFLKANADYQALFDHHPALLACDLHPGYLASGFADSLGLPITRIQHHHAHLAACLGEHQWPRDGGPVAALVMDGLGLGDDGSLWGGELLLGDYDRYRRVAHLRPAALVGGDAASREPWRNLLMRLDQAGLADLADQWLAHQPRGLVRAAARQGLNAPACSSVGRLFDAVAAALGICRDRQTYEGEAGMRLEALVDIDQLAVVEPYPFVMQGNEIDPAPMLHALLRDQRLGLAPALLSARFHVGLAQAFCAPARALVKRGEAQAVVLSGGCFQNRVLHQACLAALADVPVLAHQRIPSNDGGLALGQALIAAASAV